MNRTANIYSCVGTFQGNSKELHITLLSFKQIHVCLFLWEVDIYFFIPKPFITLLFLYILKFCVQNPHNTYLHNSWVYPLHFDSELKVRNNKHPLPLMCASCWPGWPSFPVTPPSMLMPRFKENMGNGYKNTRNSHPISIRSTIQFVREHLHRFNSWNISFNI